MTKKKKIKIKVNGKNMTFDSQSFLHQLVNDLKIPLKKIAIEFNREIVDKKRIKKIKLKNNDEIEIVHFIGGG